MELKNKQNDHVCFEHVESGINNSRITSTKCVIYRREMPQDIWLLATKSLVPIHSWSFLFFGKLIPFPLSTFPFPFILERGGRKERGGQNVPYHLIVKAGGLVTQFVFVQVPKPILLCPTPSMG